jgi:hypothetical protein
MENLNSKTKFIDLLSTGLPGVPSIITEWSRRLAANVHMKPEDFLDIKRRLKTDEYIKDMFGKVTEGLAEAVDKAQEQP